MSVVRSAMRSWMDQSKLEPSKTFLYMCASGASDAP